MYKEKFQEWEFFKYIPRGIVGKLLRIADERKPKSTEFVHGGRIWTSEEIKKKDEKRRPQNEAQGTAGKFNEGFGWPGVVHRPTSILLTICRLPSPPERPSRPNTKNDITSPPECHHEASNAWHTTLHSQRNLETRVWGCYGQSDHSVSPRRDLWPAATVGPWLSVSSEHPRPAMESSRAGALFQLPRAT